MGTSRRRSGAIFAGGRQPHPGRTPAPPSPRLRPLPAKPLPKRRQPSRATRSARSTTLTAKTIIYVKGSGTWDKAFDTITGSFKKIKAYLDKEGIKSDGLPMTIFTATDDTGFDYEAAVPIAAAPKNPPHGDITLGQSPDGQALKFVHRGSYDDLDNTYEAITNYLDDKRLEAKDMFIEEYVTDPVTADAEQARRQRLCADQAERDFSGLETRPTIRVAILARAATSELLWRNSSGL